MPAMIAGATLGAAAIGGIGSYFSGKSAQGAAVENYKHRYQWQMQDLKKAGLNPMLVVGQQPPNVPQANIPDMGESIVKGGQAGASAATNYKMAQQQIAVGRSQEQLNVSSAQKLDVERKIQEMNPAYREAEQYSLDVSNKVAGAKGVSTAGQQALDETAARINNLRLQGKSLEQDIKQNAELYPLLIKAQQQANLMQKAGMLPVQIMEKLYQEHPNLRYLQYFRDFIFGSGGVAPPIGSIKK